MIQLFPYALQLVRPWCDAAGTMTERRGILVRRGDGWGDCAPLPGRTEELDAAMAVLETPSPASRNAGEGGASVRRAWEGEGFPAAHCALETARLDHQARHAGISLARLLASDAPDSVPVNAALGELDGNCLARARAAVQAGFAVAKVKVGLAAPAEDLVRLQALAEAAPLKFRLDANRAWDEASAAGMLTALAGLPIEAVEEPLADPDVAALGRLQALVPFPLAVDESLAALGLDAVLASNIRRLVLKPMELGGPLAVLAVARRARAAGIEVVITSALDSAIGVVAAAHLAAALGEGPAHGLATLAWLESDVALRPSISGGRLHLPAGAGLGLVPFGQEA